MIRVRPLGPGDLDDAMALYRSLVGDGALPEGAPARARWAAILGHPGTSVLGAEADGRVASMATLHLMPNMTWGGRPYALIENAVTLAASRGRGLGRAVVEAAVRTAWEADAYKVMLLTGRDAGAAGFYEALGFSGDDKHGMTLRRVPARSAADPA